jgi:hypothetical protein
VPEIVGAVLAALLAWTVMLNAGSCALAWPSLTEIVTLLYVPGAGIPLSCPDAALKLAHAGRLAMENVRASPLASLAAGVNE